MTTVGPPDGDAPAARARVMGVVNVTPDSFSDGGRHASVEATVRHGLALVAAGADLLDIGGESTRPGADPASIDVELERVVPVIAALSEATDVPLSVDTMKPEVARAAAGAGATWWNDVNALRAPEALETAASLNMTTVLMHMQGEPRTMQAAPTYDDVAADVTAFLRARVGAAREAGVTAPIYVDPGIGFGKTLAHNLALMRGLSALETATGAPVLFGASRKRFIHALDPTADDPLDRLGGSLAAALHAAGSGASVIRVHDVRETVQALRVQHAIAHGPPDDA